MKKKVEWHIHKWSNTRIIYKQVANQMPKLWRNYIQIVQSPE